MGSEDKRYGRYKEIRDKVWSVLFGSGISSLPVNVSALADKLGITCLSYTEGADIIETCGLSSLCPVNDAISIFTDKWYIFTKDNGYEEGFYRKGRALFSQAHELGHIVLNHPMERIKVGYFTAYHTLSNSVNSGDSSIEREAGSFAERLLAPSCVLWAIKAFSAEAVKNAAGLPDREAERRAGRICMLAQRGSFLAHETERLLYEQFKAFIENYNPEPS